MTDRDDAVDRARAVRRWEDQDFVAEVSPAEVREHGDDPLAPLVAIVDYGLKTNIVRNGRIHAELDEQGRSLEQIAADFDKVALTTADKAAEIIHRGVERGKARILVGPDAYVFDALARIAPTSYFNVMARLFER